MATYKIKKSGYTLLVTVLITACVVLYYSNAWYSTILMNKLISNKFKYQKSYRLTESLYFFGLQLCISNFDKILKNQEASKNVIHLYKGQWPLGSHNFMAYIRALIESDSAIKIQIILIDQNNSKQDNITALISRETIKNKNTKKNHHKFNVSNWVFNNQ